uniref:Tetratricopeptide repeat protein n=1 Tax=Thermosporothrix sp. COM3 TaxID=2490863 RepID=A0A455SL76_9CHLR|nr:hypothetical protein KTC_32170 [Thermosporothrix sp. COM3]
MAQVTLRQYLQETEDAISSGRIDDAFARCQNILAHFPESLEAQRLLGEVYLAQGNLDDAQQAFDWVLTNDPENVVVYCDRALISERQGDYDTALDCYQQAYELSRGNSQIRNEFNALSARVGQQGFMYSRAGLARLYMRGSLFIQAIQEWEAVLATTPDRLDARTGLLETFWREGLYDRVEQLANQILQEVPGCVKALLLLAHVTSPKDMRQAQQLLQQAEKLDPDLQLAQDLFADMFVKQAHEPFLQLLRKEPSQLDTEGVRSGAPAFADELVSATPSNTAYSSHGFSDELPSWASLPAVHPETTPSSTPVNSNPEETMFPQWMDTVAKTNMWATPEDAARANNQDIPDFAAYLDSSSQSASSWETQNQQPEQPVADFGQLFTSPQQEQPSLSEQSEQFSSWESLSAFAATPTNNEQQPQAETISNEVSFNGNWDNAQKQDENQAAPAWLNMLTQSSERKVNSAELPPVPAPIEQQPVEQQQLPEETKASVQQPSSPSWSEDSQELPAFSMGDDDDVIPFGPEWLKSIGAESIEDDEKPQLVQEASALAENKQQPAATMPDNTVSQPEKPKDEPAWLSQLYQNAPQAPSFETSQTQKEEVSSWSGFEQQQQPVQEQKQPSSPSWSGFEQQPVQEQKQPSSPSWPGFEQQQQPLQEQKQPSSPSWSGFEQPAQQKQPSSPSWPGFEQPAQEKEESLPSWATPAEQQPDWSTQLFGNTQSDISEAQVNEQNIVASLEELEKKLYAQGFVPMEPNTLSTIAQQNNTPVEKSTEQQPQPETVASLSDDSLSSALATLGEFPAIPKQQKAPASEPVESQWAASFNPVPEPSVQQKQPSSPSWPGFEQQPVQEQKQPSSPSWSGFEQQPVQEQKQPSSPSWSGFEQQPVQEQKQPSSPSWSGFEQQTVQEQKQPSSPSWSGFEQQTVQEQKQPSSPSWSGFEQEQQPKQPSSPVWQPLQEQPKQPVEPQWAASFNPASQPMQEQQPKQPSSPVWQPLQEQPKQPTESKRNIPAQEQPKQQPQRGDIRQPAARSIQDIEATVKASPIQAARMKAMQEQRTGSMSAIPSRPGVTKPQASQYNPMLDQLEATMKRPAIRIQPTQQRGTPAPQSKGRSLANQGNENNGAKAKLLKGYQHQLVGEYDSAMKEYRSIIRNSPELLDEVVSNVRALLKLAPKYAPGYRVLGDAYMRQGEYLQAMEAYNKALMLTNRPRP